MIRRIVFLLLLSQACGDATPTRTLVRFSSSAELDVPEGAFLHVVGYGDGVRQYEDGEGLGMFNFVEGVMLPVEAQEDDGERRFTLFAEILTATGTRVSWARIRSGFVQDERREIRVEFQAACPDPSDRGLPANYDPNDACGSHDSCGALEGSAVCTSACFTPEPLGAEENTPSSPIVCPAEDDILVDVLVHGANYACALSGGEPFCWGQLGTGETSAPLFRQPSRPMTPEGRSTFRPGADEVVDIAASSNVACMVLVDGRLRCGGDDVLVLDIPQSARCCQAEPQGFPTVTEVEVGSYICALGEDEQLYCSGLVPPFAAGVDEPVLPARRYNRGTPPTWTSFFGGPSLLAGLGPERLEVLTFPEGFDLRGVNLPSATVSQVATNEYGLCVAMAEGGVRCWGEHEPLSLGEQWRRIAMSTHSQPGAPEHRCAIRMDGTLWCWGKSRDGVLGVEPRGVVSFDERVQVGGDDDWTDLSLGERVSCGVRAGGHVYCWGSNERREFGQDSEGTQVPTRVPIPRW